LHDNTPAHIATLLTGFYAENQITALFVRFGSSRLSFISKAQAQDEKSHFLRHSSDPKILLKAVPQNEFSRAFEQPYRRCNECITSQNLNVEG